MPTPRHTEATAKSRASDDNIHEHDPRFHFYLWGACLRRSRGALWRNLGRDCTGCELRQEKPEYVKFAHGHFTRFDWDFM